MADFNRNKWPLWSGTTGRIQRNKHIAYKLNEIRKKDGPLAITTSMGTGPKGHEFMIFQLAYALGRPSAQGIIIIGPVIHDNRSGNKMKMRNHFHIRDLPLRDDDIGGKIAVMVQKQMQFDGPFGSTELCPVKQGDQEINDRGVLDLQGLFG